MTTNSCSFPEEREKLLIPGSTYEIPVKGSDCPGLGHVAVPWPITVIKKMDQPWSHVPSEGVRWMAFCQGAPRELLEVRKGHLLQGRVWCCYQISPGSLPRDQN